MADKKPRRKRIGKGIYRDRYGLSAAVKVGTAADAHQREKRFPFDTSLKNIKAWQEAMRTELRKAANRPAAASRGTLEADAKLYLKQVEGLASYKSRRVRSECVDGPIWAPSSHTPDIGACPRSARTVGG